MPPTAPAPTTGPTTARRRSRAGFAAVTVAVVLLAGMWVYALFIAKRGNPDKFPDRAWAASAEQVCKATADRLAAGDLLKPWKLADVQPRSEALRLRADMGQQATDALRGMVDELRALPAPADAKSSKGVGIWLADWDTYLGDRYAHIAEWRQGIDKSFAETARNGTPITLQMNAFADVNEMKSCDTPDDFG